MNPEKTSPEKTGRTLVKDPVCNMNVDPASAAGSSGYKGQTYYFCSTGCVKRFNAEPEKYLSPHPPAAQLPKNQMVQIGAIIPAPADARPITKPAQDTSAGKGTVTYVCPMDPEVRESKPGACPKCGMALEPETVEYTCPMHPEIVRNGPGNCPICGMALEPRVAAGVHEEDDSELRSMQRRFWVGVALQHTFACNFHGRHGRRQPSAQPARWMDGVVATLARHAGRALGRMAILPARMGVPRQSTPEYVHAHRHGHRHGVSLQRDCDACARHFPAILSRPRRQARSLF